MSPAPRAARTESARGCAHREAAWKVELSARLCTDRAHAARLRGLAAWHQRQADHFDQLFGDDGTSPATA
ncbi:hypothetical protein [Cryptosporangium arvum]|uniref:Uncharacterized protein n=1 Tax=Cryptosporangium arvum DSM 44712 TaxID=927661 RepID=A0A011ACB5_9ACTN|nr:hypothetical protein [Cryptosporangium arvum]EXG79681.1 hypothetical protein CryarDRAFT_0724 [Cryptosporangium arvum DSM 44712]